MKRQSLPIWLLAILLLGACRRERTPGDGAPPSAPEVVRATTPQLLVASQKRVLDDLEFCETRHRGLVLDLGSATSEQSRSFRIGPFADLTYEAHSSEHWGVIHSRSLDFDFWLDRDAEELELAGRFEGGTARSVSAAIDGAGLGARTLVRGDALVLRFPALHKAAARGRHVLTLKFTGKVQAGEAVARAGWLRVYRPGDADPAFPAPTRQTLVEETAIGGEARRAISLRAPGSLRCPIMPVVGSRLRVSAGLRGGTTGRAAVSAILPDGNSVTLWESELTGGDEVTWTPIDVSLDAFAGQEIGLHFSAEATTGRVLFSEPTIERFGSPKTTPLGRTAIIVLVGGMDRPLVPPWGPRAGLNNIFAVADQGVVFDGYRASSSIVTAVAATVLTGVSPAVHGVLSAAGRVPRGLPLLVNQLRETGSNSAFFTNVPSTAAVFGFDRGFGLFEQHSPLEDLPAAAPLLALADWLRKTPIGNAPKLRLAVAHVTGGHPPWDASVEELATLAPKDYEGLVDARRGGVTLHDARLRQAGGRRGLSPADWLRLRELQDLSLRKVDLGLGSIVRALQETGQWEDTLLVLMGDVASGDRPEVPFAPDGPLTEGRLTVPLIVKFPHGFRPRPIVMPHVGTESVARTVLQSLGLDVALQVQAPALSTLAEDADLVEVRPVLARTMNNYACYVGRYVLRGAFGSEPTLHDLEVDPGGQLDLSKEQPLLVQWLWRSCARELKRGSRVNAPEPETADIDADTRAAMAAYGI